MKEQQKIRKTQYIDRDVKSSQYIVFFFLVKS
jgi:hypothetical protein